MIKPPCRPLVLAVMTAAALAAAACGESGPATPTSPGAPYSQADILNGTGSEAVNGRRVTVHYTGWIYDPRGAEQKGRQFDTSAGGEPFSFVLGSGAVIRGFDQGVPGMRVGGVRRLVLPPDMAYGSGGVSGVIPPYATLVFDVELVSVDAGS